jgi:hypothetical protein
MAGGSARRQQRHVGLSRGMQPHAHVHRRRRQHGLVGRQQQRGRQIVADPGGHLRQDVGGGRRDDDQVCAARQFDMAHLALVGQREQVAVDLGLGQRLQCQRRNELRARLRQHAGDTAIATTQQADQLRDLESRDAARNDQQHALAGKIAHDSPA